MSKLICPNCMAVHQAVKEGNCPHCKATGSQVYQFQNSDDYLEREVPRVIQERKELGLNGLVGGLEAIIINTERDRLRAATEELLATTGYQFSESFSHNGYQHCVLNYPGSADILVSARLGNENPFREFNLNPKSEHRPNSRLETFVFRTEDLDSYVNIQQGRGVRFLTETILEWDNYRFIQTIPSSFTGVSIGLIQWKGGKRSYLSQGATGLGWVPKKPETNHLQNIGVLDHTASRVHARDRDAAIIEFMELTNYHFDFAIYVKSFNSITNVARLSKGEFAMVFTSGITPFQDLEHSGPTEKFIHNYGTRTHHLAFDTKNIEETYQGLKDSGMGFLLELVGSPEEGLKQTFSEASPNTLLVNEYIHRYGDFTGFFTRSNVTQLTESTEKQ